MNLFISPHNDDEALFGAFTILRERPLVLIVTDSKRQAAKGINAIERRNETLNASRILEAAGVEFLGIPDAELEICDLVNRLNRFIADHGRFEHVYFPAWECNGNKDHNLIATVCQQVIDVDCCTHYLTYTTEGKSRSQRSVAFDGNWPMKKLIALSCYRSQILEPSTRDHFLRDQYEYYAS